MRKKPKKARIRFGTLFASALQAPQRSTQLIGFVEETAKTQSAKATPVNKNGSKQIQGNIALRHNFFQRNL